MKKIISGKTWAAVKGKYVVGKTTIGQIAKDHNISRKSIERKAKKEGWQYGVLSDEVAKAVESATIENIVKKDTDKATKITERFIEDSENVRRLTMAILSGMANELKKSGGNVSRAEAERILFCQRVNETSIKTLAKAYDGVRKALGIDLRSGDGSLTPESPQNSIERTIELVKKAMDRGIDADKITSVSNDN